MAQKEKIKILNRRHAERVYRYILNESRKTTRFCRYCNKTSQMTNEEFGVHTMNCEEDFIVNYAKNNFSLERLENNTYLYTLCTKSKI